MCVKGGVSQLHGDSARPGLGSKFQASFSGSFSGCPAGFSPFLGWYLSSQSVLLPPSGIPAGPGVRTGLSG